MCATPTVKNAVFGEKIIFMPFLQLMLTLITVTDILCFMTNKPSIIDLLSRSILKEFSLVELAAETNHLLARMPLAMDDGRTSERVDARTIRFYQSIGIITKPKYEGRCAVYAFEHLLRLLVAKRLQSEGYSLAQVQSTIPQQNNDQLIEALEKMKPQPVFNFIAEHSEPVQEKSVRGIEELQCFSLCPGITIMIDPQLHENVSKLVRHLAAETQSFINSSRTTPHTKGD